MALRHPCPECRREMFLEKVHEGFEVPCPHCGATLLVAPGTVGDAAEVPPAELPPPERPPTAAEGALPLVLGIVGMFGNLCCIVLAPASPVAWFVGHRGRRTAREQGRAPLGAVTAGWVLGIVGTVLLVLRILITGGVFLFAALGN